jgi:hypothetical protein
VQQHVAFQAIVGEGRDASSDVQPRLFSFFIDGQLLSGPPAFLEYQALEPGLFNVECAAFSGLQHAFPTPRHAQPEFAVSFVRSLLNEAVALLDLLLKEIAFKHAPT